MRRTWTASKEVDLSEKMLEEFQFHHEPHGSPMVPLFHELLSLVSITAVLKGRRWEDTGSPNGPIESQSEPEGGQEIWIESIDVILNNRIGQTRQRVSIPDAPELYKLAEGLCETEPMEWVEAPLE